MDLFLFISILSFVLFYIWFFPLKKSSKISVYTIAEPATFSLIVLCLTAWVGTITIYFLRDGNHFNKVIDHYIKNDGLILSLVTLTVIIMTYISKLNQRVIKKINLSCSTRVTIIDWFVLSIIILILVFYLYIDGHFILRMFQASDQYAIMALRKESTSAGSDYLFKRVVIDGIFWISLLYYYSIKKKPTSFSLFLYFTTFVFSLFLFISLKKIPLILLLLSIFLVVNYNKKLNLIKIVKLIIFFFIIMFFIYFLLIKNINLEYMLSPFKEGLIGRIFISGISSLYAHMEIFSNNHLGIESLSKALSNFLGINFSPRSGEIVMATVNPSWVEMGIGGTYNTLFLGEAFANFSYPGLIISIFYIAFYYFFITRSIVLFPPSFRIPFLVYLCLNVNMMSGFNDYIYNPFLVLIYLFFIFRKILSFLFKTQKRTHTVYDDL
ncbi:O-antigen polymerase [Providencia rettgeri]|uniref:O-antigen polymerase n=1 Tax=Providencia rettgeri TaxID=587 RepID=UPI001419AEF2|nr:O-antigen polymerase [Providencia rettgeri]NIH03330.1 oligosaccharide repeat unit polymerase [Providencia rettgeri]